MSEQADISLDRRRFLQQGAAAAAALGCLGVAASEAPRTEKPDAPARIGVIGLGGRGTFLLRSLVSYFPHVTVPAVCDLKPDRLQAGIELVKKIRGAAPVGYGKDEFDAAQLN
jgi:D-arabinose 1-dehydrogenase-like Zn-dependent alcohol dehydrogenase